MKICFIGLGSIATRHIKNLKKIFGNEVSISVLRSGKGKAIANEIAGMIDKILYSANELEKWYDIIFITNPTACHYDSLNQYDIFSNAFFIEKPVFLTGNEDISKFKNNGKIYYVACPLRYTRVIQYLKNEINRSKVYAVRCISSSYLPDWRPGTDYRMTYSAHREMGGGVSIDLVHEWDYIHYIFGKPNNIQSLIARKSSLEIDSDDIAVYMAEYDDMVVELHLDYFGQVPIRYIEIFLENDTIFCDLIAQKIRWGKNGIVFDFTEQRNDYQIRELEHFFRIVDKKEKNDNSLEFSCRTLRYARGLK